MLGALLVSWSWPEFRHHPWRSATALMAVALGVALAFSVHLINASALSEFSSAVRSISGQPDFELRGQAQGFDESLYERVAAHPGVAIASPVVEVETRAFRSDGKSIALRIIGQDALVNGPLAPALLPLPGDDAPRLAMLDPDSIFINAAARSQLGIGVTQDKPSDRQTHAAQRAEPDATHAATHAAAPATPTAASPAPARSTPTPASLRLQAGSTTLSLALAGSIANAGSPLAVMDIAGVQQHFGWAGRLSRIDVRLEPGASRDEVIEQLHLPPGVRAASPDEAAQRVSNLSRAYRVNLTVLALVALFTGAFLVFSILSLSVAKRQPQLALLGVLGLAARDRLVLVLAESALLGVAGSVIGIALGTALAATALRFLDGDLGGGYFTGATPTLQFGGVAALVYGMLGVAAALIGGWFPARSAQRLAPAQALKGLGSNDLTSRNGWVGPALVALGAALSFAPPIAGLPLAAYVAVACLLMGGIACVPGGVAALLSATRPPENPLALLAVQRARHQRQTATVAVAGVVASLALSVALTVMVGSFRESVDQWLGVVLPADLYVRGGGTASGAGDTSLDPVFIESASRLPGVARVETLHVVPLQLDPVQPDVALIARAIGEPARSLPLVGSLVDAPAGATAVYVSEAVATLYGAKPGSTMQLPRASTSSVSAAASNEAQKSGDGTASASATVPVFVRGIWRDYARQFGAIAIDTADFRRIWRDDRVNDVSIWLDPSASAASVEGRLRSLADASPQAGALEISSAARIRETSLHIFDRSFAVTSYLQTLAIGLGLFGIAASFSAQVLARRKEFGLLSHLGLTRAEVLGVVAAEGAVWTAAGALMGLVLGLAVSVVLVDVVNPQSFNWTMDLLIPWGRLTVLCVAVVAAGTFTAFVAGRAAAGRDAALAVKEDW